MILVDTSVWVDHLRRGDAALVELLERSLVWCHPLVVGELACGLLRDRAKVLGALQKMPCAPVASHAEALVFLDRHALAGRGVGWVDVHLLASTALGGDARLWTCDKRLAAAAVDLGLDYLQKAP